MRALAQAGAEIRQWIVETPFQPRLQKEIDEFYDRLVADSITEMSFAVRSSATAEDLPDASFAGQQETFLNVVGIDNVLEAMKHVFASLYNDRAISYRVHKGFTHAEVALSAGVQRMVRSDLGAAGVMFTLDTESGFKDVVFITSSYGLGETVVQGAVNPDEFYVHKPMLEQGKLPIIRRNIGSKLIKMEFTSEAKAGRSVKTVDVPIEMRNRYSLNDAEVVELAKYAVIIEKHYGRPMDIEWGKDGRDGKLYILQARPETVKSQQKSTDAQQRFKLKGSGTVLASRPRDRPEDRRRSGARDQRSVRDGARAAGRRAGGRHDRSELGAGDEARFGHRHQSRRPHLPRGDHRARTGRAGSGRLRRRDRTAQGRHPRHRVLRRRRRGQDLRRLAGNRSDGSGARRTAGNRR